MPIGFGDTTEDMAIVKEEILGPVVAGGRRLDGKMLRAPTPLPPTAKPVSSGSASPMTHIGIPFVGVKQTAFGREMGPYTIEMYTHTKGRVHRPGIELVNFK